MDGLAFKKCINEMLKPYGFRRTGKNWGVEKDGLLIVVTIYKSSYCNGYSVQCGAKLNCEKYVKYPEAGTLDTYDIFLFPADPDYKADAYREALHTLPKGEAGHHWIVRQYIDLDLFHDATVIEAIRHNIEKRLLPMLSFDELKQLLQNDQYYIGCSFHPENLLKYGVSEEQLIKYSSRYRSFLKQ